MRKKTPPFAKKCGEKARKDNQRGTKGDFTTET